MNGLYLQLIFLIISYLLGSIPWALIIGKIVKVKIIDAKSFSLDGNYIDEKIVS